MTDANKTRVPAWIVVSRLFGCEALLWSYFLLFASRGSSSFVHLGPRGHTSRIIEAAGSAVLITALALAPIKRIRRKVDPLTEVIAVAIYCLSAVVYVFATLYYEYGLNNWTKPLSHVDAIFVALGMLTTAGTGELQASTDFARGLLVMQMVADLLVFTAIVGVVTHRIVGES
jgi:hypothetical protein